MIETDELGTRLAEKLVFLTNDFDLPSFEPCQLQALVCLLIRSYTDLPRCFLLSYNHYFLDSHTTQLNRHMTGLLYAKETGMPARMLILSVFGHTALQLSSAKAVSGLPDLTTVVTVHGSVLQSKKSRLSFSQIIQFFFLPLIGGLVKWCVSV
jgi:hypothetical protein